MSSHEFEPPDLDRFRVFGIALVVSMLLIALAVGSLVYALHPDYGAAAAYGIGAFVGFWMSPLPAGVASCAVNDRRGEHDDTPAVTSTGSTPGGVSPAHT